MTYIRFCGIYEVRFSKSIEHGRGSMLLGTKVEIKISVGIQLTEILQSAFFRGCTRVFGMGVYTKK